ncbi:MAG: hypothetical protein HY965_06455, partial [Ignavibacteriales bacterium]|nr:hypothetical protein [Ignavibacteriales bacterium]
GANGALVAMNDESNAYPFRVTVQKINTSGAPQWGTNGVQVTASTGFTQYLNNICSDGAGGIIATWNDQRNSFSPDFYTQRISSAGTKLWGNSGVHLSSGSGFTDACSVTPDGASGAYFAFLKSSPSYTIFAQHVSSDGALSYGGTGAVIVSGANTLTQAKVTGTTEGNAIISWLNSTAKIVYAQKIDSTCATLWTANGVGVATSSNEKTSYCEAVTDGGGGAIISFVENRAGNNFDIFAQQINSGGVLGSSPFASIVSVTSPNGAENLFAGETHNITWTSANIANVKIEYSTNNGTNWSTISASTTASSGSYAWTVPANSTAQAKVKISDASNNLISDQSNAVFTITVGTLTLTSPDGGEIWVEGRSQNITWTSGNVSNVKLEYSSDNGANWNMITNSTAAAAGSYAWNIPGVASSQALVKVTDADHASLSDISNAVFTLRQCNTPDWTFSPVGYQYTMNIVGKLYFEGSPSEHLNDKVAVFVGNQLRGTARVSLLAANTYRVYLTVYSNQASGENLLFQAWDSLNCKTYPRITQEYTFTSNAVIGSLSTPANLSATETLPTLGVTSPNGGEGWIAQTTQNITWASSSVTNIKIEYSTNNGGNWSTISSSTPASTGTYAWAVPTIASAQALVRLTNLFDTSYTDASNAAFSLLIPSVSVTAPNGGETDTATGTRSITWTSSYVSDVKIEYSANNGSSWNTIAASTPANAGSYAWTVPTIATAQVLVRVSDASNANFADTSDAVSTIVIPSISVTSPNGGESYASTFSQNITWTSSNTSVVKIEYSSNNGTDWNTISAGTAASAGTFAWTIPSITSSQVLVRISNANFLSFTDTSNAVFSIFLPAVTLTAPNGGESWNAAASQNITWTSSNVTNVKLEYSTNNGSSWNTISAGTAAAAGTYAWTVPSVSTLQAMVKISDAAYPSFSDMSDAVFTIQLVDRFYMHSGWTWVSFNKHAANMSVSSVLTGLTPTANDLIKDQTTFA